MENKNNLWNEFEKTGSIQAYLKYKGTGFKNSAEPKPVEQKNEQNKTF